MWSRKEIKREARAALKKNYLRSVIVCLIMAVFFGVYSYSFSKKESSGSVNYNYKGISNSQIVNNLLNNISEEEKTEWNQTIESVATRGVLANIFNNATKSSSFLFGLLNSLNQFFFQDQIFASVIILVGAIIEFLYWLFIGNVIRVGEKRFFLESIRYPHTKVNRILYLIKIRRLWNVIIIMFLRTIRIVLWSFTIAGGFIKNYSYRMVPFILAENPNISRKEVFKLSENMMKGNKWKAFRLDMSFWLWEILSSFTFGLVGFLYVNPYKTLTYAQLYFQLRNKALEEEAPLSYNFNDIYLTELPQDYNPDIYGESIGTYPIHLYGIAEQPSRKWITTDYHKNYSFSNLILLFFTYSMIGWVWEVALELVSSGNFVNRGVLFGPWLPIYGSGGVLMLILLKKWIDRPIITFFLVVTISGVVEYFTGWYLEVFKGAKWWDYSGYLFNLNGRICLEGLFIFGMGGCASIYFLAPILNNLLVKFRPNLKYFSIIVLVLLFCGDFLYSSKYPNQVAAITVGEGFHYVVSSLSMLLFP